jgi:L-lactate permease
MGSNMTQGGIQAVAAARLGVPVTSMLAVQVAGACAGKMVCISSILVSCHHSTSTLAH